MVLDYNSLLLAIGFSGICLSVALMGVWLSARTEAFLLTWAIGVVFVVGTVFTYHRYAISPEPAYGAASAGMLIVGLAIIYGAAVQFRGRRMPRTRIAAVAAGALLAVPTLFLSGWNGLGFIVENAVAAALLLATALEYWRARNEAPVSAIGLSGLYAVTGLSFVLCSVVLLADGELVLARAPENWAEKLSIVISIAGLTGIGALSLSLNQARLARSHRRDAMTDSLTGLLNRRALFDRFAGAIAKETAVIVFDLDRFKGINDDYGHAVGDEVLKRFATAAREAARPADAVARLGGEEFAVIMPATTPDLANRAAEGIRALFAAGAVETEKGRLVSTVSAGIAFMAGEGHDLDGALRLADEALYLAKRDGRNRVVSPPLRLAG
jgi:diguanylate cyclase (GGDEF)-like protein